jgi:hypothetical protein
VATSCEALLHREFGLSPSNETEASILAKQPPLHTRAWVVQERCLLTRTLNFDTKGIFWDCNEKGASEIDPVMVSTNAEESLKRRFYDILVFATEGWHLRHHWLRDCWEFVNVYTSCDLSYATDRWPAFQGLVTGIQHGQQKSLVHVLWQHRLLDELLLILSNPGAKRLNNDEPSWSWLNIGGTILKKYVHYTNYCQPDAM